MEEATIERQLSGVPMFSRLGRKHLHTLATTAKDQTYAAGEVIVKEGEKAIKFYLVVEGKVAVERSGKVLTTLGPGQFFGEMALLDEQPRTANVRAVGPSRCLIVYSWEFWTTVGKDPEALRSLLTEAILRLRKSAPAPED